MGVATVTQLCLPGHPPCNRITAELGMRGAAGELEGIQEGAALRDYSSCVHGLGHGLMMHAQGDRADGFGGARMNDASLVSHADLLGERAALTRALSVCNAGPRPSESCQCASGVYMQFDWQYFGGFTWRLRESLRAACEARLGSARGMRKD
eukprot:scaffold293245_cov35-Tisochrysis_lutea.AAC.3